MRPRLTDGDPSLSTRDRLIAAAFATVARDGMGGTSVKAIAALAGV